MAKATVYIHGGDFDCSELVRMCYRAVGVLPYGSYMWTGNERELLRANGFVQRPLSSPQKGDVLWRSGHTEMYLGDGMQGGARHGDYAGGLDGRQGDQDGTEVTRSAYRASDWTVLLRYEGGKDVGGIPCAVAAALVADHIIDHDAHGYSQPHRAGDGTVEAVTIEWDGGTPVAYAKASGRWRFDREVRVRTAPSTAASVMTARWQRGDVMAFDRVYVADGIMWGSYVGPTTKKRLYAAMMQGGMAYGEMV